MSPSAVFFWLCVAHCVADYPLQGDFLARAKNWRAPVRAANGQAFPWPIALGAHAMIHAGGVALVTGSITLGLYELAAHLLIDFATSAGWNDYASDQLMHVACKILWAWLAVRGIR